MGYSQHGGMVIVADGTDDAARRLERVLWNDPATGVMRHADAGYRHRHRLRARAGPAILPMVDAHETRSDNVDLTTLRRFLAVGEGGTAPPRRCGDAARRRCRRDSVERIVAGGETVYGVNTGFGLLANTRIPDDRLAELQTNLILSHSAGLGDPLPRHVTRLMIVLKLLGLGRGYSGVRPLVIEALQALLDADAMPLIPTQGSVGAVGRPRPARASHRGAHGPRPDRRRRRRSCPRRGASNSSASSRSQLGPKEGLALINGTQASTAHRARRACSPASACSPLRSPPAPCRSMR